MPKPTEDYQYIDQQSPLDELAVALEATSDKVAIDIEADSLYHYHHKVCLMQMTFEGINYIIDTLADLDFAVFYQTLSQKSLLLHNGDYDLRMMRSSSDFQLQQPFFDTMLAARLLGYRQYSLASIANEMLGVSMSKKGQKSDWSKRPLSQMQLDYAVYDTKFLHHIAEDFRQRLIELNRLHWLEQTCEKLLKTIDIEKPEPDQEKQWRLKGIRWFNPRQLALVKYLWLWREQQASDTDAPPFKIMSNQLIIDLAIWKSENPYAKLKSPGCPLLPRNCTGERFRSLGKAIKDAFDLPLEACPEPLRSHFIPQPAGPMYNKLKDACQQIADDLDIDVSVLAPRAAITAISRQRPGNIAEIVECTDLLPWQAELINDAVQALSRRYR